MICTNSSPHAVYPHERTRSPRCVSVPEINALDAASAGVHPKRTREAAGLNKHRRWDWFIRPIRVVHQHMVQLDRCTADMQLNRAKRLHSSEGYRVVTRSRIDYGRSQQGASRSRAWKHRPRSSGKPRVRMPCGIDRAYRAWRARRPWVLRMVRLGSLRWPSWLWPLRGPGGLRPVRVSSRGRPLVWIRRGRRLWRIRRLRRSLRLACEPGRKQGQGSNRHCNSSFEHGVLSLRTEGCCL
jgi:hypothetical protein